MRASSPSIARPGEGREGAVPARQSARPKPPKPPGSPSLGGAPREPGSPSLGSSREPPTGGSRNVAPKRSPVASPSMLGFSPTEGGGHEGAEPPPLELPGTLTSSLDSVSIGPGKVPVQPPVPDVPPTFQSVSLVGDASGVGADEAYSRDEAQLNNFLKLHPMLSLEATSQRTLQMLSSMFEKAAITSKPILPVVPKSHDDIMLAPANEDIGERPCVNKDTCLANVIAHVRYGMESDKAFVCKEFLLPDQHAKFLQGEGLPQRRGKCLLCARYFQSYVYLLARTDPAFKVGQSPLGMQVFCNPVTHVPTAKVGEDENLQQAATELPLSVCAVSAKDGYKPSATLFVDEDWMTLRSARESNLGQLLFRPVVR